MDDAQNQPKNVRPSNPHFRAVIWTVLVVFVAGLLALFAFRSWKSFYLTSKGNLPNLRTVEPFTMTERSGETVSNKDLQGKIWVANFIFTECPGICHNMSAQFAQLQHILRKTRDVRLVTFSIDPHTDTPEVLTEYAKRFQADPRMWLFLTGDLRDVHRLAEKSFLLPVAENPPEAIPMDGKYLHSSRLVLVDAHGMIRGYYDGSEPEALQKLAMDIGFLMREGGLK
ncbi:SCO family protein [Kamptonema cortianum]|uniref:SCO family protein n=1 Tax=Geitlerinema calcuttense NRMC-F 0142 TaxID=2922238 RepID=A0ABT7M0X3_9CYAN|nr:MULTISPECIES: SCO family protein [Cyanophyceae]MDK3161793.1 SCO family protein [Kamptonema cortianum]MDL5054365.1 SCO family protein [Oscillatoria laete-virens NRMC-F 0139]MDL5057912.1 SCO family protein [Geitlerinema calcuttense NRMC-F 0142]